jgi:hypothetical protein
MKALAFFLVLLCTPAFAQTVAPGQRYFLGPTLGEQWDAPGAYMPMQFNAQTGTTYTILATDFGKVVTISNANPIAVTLPVATTSGFAPGKCFVLISIGAGTATVTPTTSTINGQTTKAYATNVGSRICSDGTNYYAY